MMKKLILATVLTLSLATWSSAELVENGDFSDNVAYWLMAPASGYGKPAPEFAVVDGALEATNLREVDPNYLLVQQPVNVQKGKRYKLSYEVKADGGGYYLVTIQHVLHDRHYMAKNPLPGSSWESVEVEFEGAFDTDEKWLKKYRSATKKNELIDGKTPRSEKLKKIKSVKRSEPASRSTLFFHIGAVTGSFAVRNISVVEVK